MEDIIRIEDIIKIFKNGWKIIVTITIVCTLIAAIISYFYIKPKYETTVKVFIGKKTTIEHSRYQNNNESNLGYDSSEVSMYQSLMQTYAQVITTKDSIGLALKSIGLSNTQESIKNILYGLSVTTSKNTQILDITYKSTNKNEMVPIINSITNVFIAQSKKLISNGNVQVIEAPQVPSVPISPNKKLNIIIGFIIGLVLSVGIIFLLEYLDNSIKSADELEYLLGIPVIGIIPEIKE